MVTNFALSLSFDGIALLRRTGDVWAHIQEVPLDSGDLDAAVLGLRNRAEGLDPSGAQVTLIIPNEQIRYLKIPDPGGNAASQDLAVRAALDGATPYQVADLVYDFVTKKDKILIAAVAKETLEEAEGFAVQNGFEPVAHSAQAPKGEFYGAVFFGATSNWTGQTPSRLAQAIRIVPADATALSPVVVPAAEEDQHDRAENAHENVAENPEPDAPRAAAEPVNNRSLEGDQPPDADEAATGPQAELNLQAPDAVDGISSPEPLAEQEPPKADPKTENVNPQPTAKEVVTAPMPAAPKQAQPDDNAPAARDQDTAPAKDVQDVHEPDAEVPAAPVAFSTIRATRREKEVPPRPTEPIPQAERPSAQIKPRFTPVASPDTRVKDAGVTGPGLAEKPPVHALAKPGVTPAAPSVAPSVAPPKMSGPPPVGKPDQTPLPKHGAGQTPAAPSAESALTRLAALRARTDSAQGDDAGVAMPAAPKAKQDKPVAAAPIVAKAPPKAALPPTPGPTPPTAEALDAKPKVKSPLGRIAALRAKPEAKTNAANAAVAAAAAASLTAQSERDRMTVFGARNQPEVGGKPRFLGILLTAGLLLFMAGVAAWASVFLDDGLAGLFRSEPKEIAIASAPDIAPEAVAETAKPPAQNPASDVQLAALETGLTSDPENETLIDAPKPRSVPVQPRMLSPEEAAATYAATGIWQRAPIAPLGIPTDAVDDVYVASIDPKVQESDAVALPDPLKFSQDPAIEEPRLPPAAGQVFDMDARGLVRATPEGALSPDGIRVYTGLPPAVPPLRSALADPVQTPDPALNETLRNLRPKLRPGNLIEERERATLSGRSLAELASIRPLMRPKTAQEVAVAEEPEAVATAQAVKASLSPVGRPRNMQAIVKRVERTAPAEPVQNAAIAPRTVKPAAPSSRGVAQSATVRNAINLKKISLIGVYGTTSQRRALVRLPNGKYKKVKVGDQLDGGRVAAIGDSELRYTKSGRNVSLKMPRS